MDDTIDCPNGTYIASKEKRASLSDYCRPSQSERKGNYSIFPNNCMYHVSCPPHTFTNLQSLIPNFHNSEEFLFVYLLLLFSSTLVQEVLCLRRFLRLWKNNCVSRKPCKRKSNLLVLNEQMRVPK